MNDLLLEDLAEYGAFHRAEQQPITTVEVTLGHDLEPDSPPPRSRRGWLLGATALVAVAALILGVALVVTRDNESTESVTADLPEQEAPSTSSVTEPEPAAPETTVPETTASDTGPTFAAPGQGGESLPTAGTPLPDFAAAVPGDDGTGPLPLGEVNTLPNEDRLDFLFEFGCPGDCYRDAHFMDPANSQLGSGPWTAGRPFHIRHGFINNGAEPLGDGFDVVVYATPMDGGLPESGGIQASQTIVYTSDYVLSGTSDQCGPTYKAQTEPQTCEWFVHDFPEGLSEGRWAIWAVWEAPCAAWIDLGLTESCTDPDEIISLFSSGVDSPFDSRYEPEYQEVNEAQLTSAEVEELRGSMSPLGPPVPSSTPPVGPSGAAATGWTPLPDFAGAVAGDGGGPPLPLGEVATLPNQDRLDFLEEVCSPGGCFRDARWVSPTAPDPWPAGRPFHISHGFINNGTEPLGDGFDVVIYATPMDIPSEFGGIVAGQTTVYTSDYVLRDTSERCGPTYRSQVGAHTCEWFVHDFPDGLPVGRWAIWAVWEAPCGAWIDLGFTDTCDDPDAVISLFSSGVDSPFEDVPIN